MRSGVSLLFLNATATTEIYTLSLHDALPISRWRRRHWAPLRARLSTARPARADRKSTRLNSSHVAISYAVFCLKKKIHVVLQLAERSALRAVLLDTVALTLQARGFSLPAFSP